MLRETYDVPYEYYGDQIWSLFKLCLCNVMAFFVLHHFLIRKENSNIDNYDIAIDIIDDEATIEKVIKTSNKLMLVAENSKYEPMMRDVQEVYISGKVVGVLKIS